MPKTLTVDNIDIERISIGKTLKNPIEYTIVIAGNTIFLDDSGNKIYMPMSISEKTNETETNDKLFQLLKKIYYYAENAYRRKEDLPEIEEGE